MMFFYEKDCMKEGSKPLLFSFNATTFSFKSAEFYFFALYFFFQSGRILRSKTWDVISKLWNEDLMPVKRNIYSG